MKNNQRLSISFWLKKPKATKDGRAPIYARITIDGAEERISLGCKCHPDFWDVETKRVLEPGKETKAANLKIAGMEASLQSHFCITLINFKFKLIKCLPIEKQALSATQFFLFKGSRSIGQNQICKVINCLRIGVLTVSNRSGFTTVYLKIKKSGFRTSILSFTQLLKWCQ